MLHAQDVLTTKDARKIVEKRDLQHVKIAITDLNGVMRSKYLARDKFISALDHGFGFCNVILGTDMDDQLLGGMELTGWHTGYPDAKVRIIPESCRDIPFEPKSLLFLCEFEKPVDQLCPRQLLKRVVAKAKAMGFTVCAALEYEYTVFDETPDSVREKNYRNLKTITPGNFGYSMLRNTVWAEFYQELLDVGALMRIPIEGFHTEIGPGVLESAISKSDALEAADRAVLFKTMTKIIAERQGLMATFMAKWNPQLQGQSGHIHLSLTSTKGDTVFYDQSQPYQMSQTMRHFVAGQQQLMPELLAMVAPNVNSFARLVPGYWAPTDASWGVDNRTCALRVIHGSPTIQRVEYRIGAADSNPYLAMAAALASGLWGIEQKCELSPVTEGNAYEKTFAVEYQLPLTLAIAAERLKNSKVGAELFGEQFIHDYVATREWEVLQARKAVTDWQLQRYFESV